MSKYHDGMGKDVSSYVQSLETQQEKLKAYELTIIQLEAEIARLKSKKKVIE
jgi:cell division protein FtsB